MENGKTLDRPTIDLALSNIQMNKIQGRICTKWKNEILNNVLIKNTNTIKGHPGGHIQPLLEKKE